MLVASFANSSRLKPEIRLAQAVSEFEATLSAEQKAEFRTCRSQARKSPPDIGDVMRLTAEIDRSASRKGRRCFGPRLTNVLQAVQQFASLGDIIIGGSQNLIACGVWSLVRMTLLTVAQSGSYLEKLSVLFMDVGRSAPRYQAMALLYSRSNKLQGYLCEYFIAVVRLCQETANYAKKSSLAQLSSNLVDSEMKNIQSELELWANSIKEEVILLSSQTIEDEAKESSTFRELVLKSTDSASHRRKTKTRLRWLDTCSTYDYVTPWKQARKKGSPTWFTRNTMYNRWKEGYYPGTLYLTGNLGSGKTIIMASIIDDLNLDSHSHKDTIAYFFCRHDISESLMARTILRCLARQLLQARSNMEKIIEIFEDEAYNLDSEADVYELLRNTLAAAVPSEVYRIILDGVDECEDGEKRKLIQLLERLQGEVPLLICISVRSRVNADFDQHYSPSCGVVLDIPADNPDISDFIEAELEARLESGKLVIGNAALILEIQDALQFGAQGMFLWVALQMASICDERTDDAIRTALKDLPHDLSETFRRILRKSGQTSGIRYQHRILRHITAACRPLTVEELCIALSVEVGVTSWDPGKTINNIIATLECCGSLIAIDEEELTVRFAHHSILQFLTGGLGEFPEYQFTLDHANTEMGHVIVTYLNYGIFDTQITRLVVPRIPAKETPSKIVNSVLGQSGGVKQLALGLLRSRRKTGYDIGKILSDTSNTQQESTTTFHLLPYAKQYWYNHTEDYWEKSNYVMLSLWCQMLQGSQVQVSLDLTMQIHRRLEQFSYYPVYPQGKLRLRRAIRVIMLANRIRPLRRLKNTAIIWGVGIKEAIFREIVRAVLIEIKAAKELERYEKALKVVETVKKSLPPHSSMDVSAGWRRQSSRQYKIPRSESAERDSRRRQHREEDQIRLRRTGILATKSSTTTVN